MQKIACPFCGSRDFEELCEIGKYARPCHTGICCQCGLVYNNPRLTTDALDRLYDEEYWRLYGGKMPTSLFSDAIAENRCEMISDYVEGGSMLLDIGFGMGQFLAAAKDRFADCRLAGIESYKPVCQLVDKALPEALILAGSLEKVADNAPKSDVITLFSVLEHLPYPIQSLAKIRQLMKPNAYLCIEVPNIWSIHFLGPNYFFRDVHLFNFSASSLSYCLGKAGLEVVNLSVIPRGNHLFAVARPSSRTFHSVFPLDDVDALKAYVKEARGVPTSPYILCGGDEQLRHYSNWIETSGLTPPSLILSPQHKSIADWSLPLLLCGGYSSVDICRDYELRRDSLNVIDIP